MFDHYIEDRPGLNFAFQLLIGLLCAVSIAIALNLFLIPGDLFASGITGIAQIIDYFTSRMPALGSFFTVGNIYFMLNIPIIILAWIRLGKYFTLMTLYTVILTTVFTNLVPVYTVSTNPLLNAIMGGVINGVGSGIAIKYGISAGGLDIVTLIVSRATGLNVGSISFAINFFIISAAGMIFDWENALFTLISIYVLSRMVDTIHTNEQRLTAFIVTTETDDVVNAIYKAIVRGVTILEGKGGYSRDRRDVLMVVLNRYEMYALQKAVRSVDSNAFVNIIHSTKVSGQFYSRQEQQMMRKQVKVHDQEEQKKDLSGHAQLSSDEEHGIIVDLTNRMAPTNLEDE